MSISIKGLSHYYPNGKKALNNINLEIPSGMFGLLGPNGAGKSTLMRILVTLMEPTEGQIDVCGYDIRTQRQEVRRILGYLPQDFGYYPSYTAKDYLEYIAVLKGIPRRAAAIKIKELLDEVGLFDVSKKKIRTYSGGMKQRLGIAQALLNDPRILILDEPTAGLDPKERVRFRNLLSSLARDRIVILSTHIVSDIEAIADRVFVMKRGQFVSQGSIRELLAEVQGHVWELAIDPAETEKWEEETTVANLRREDHQTILRVISEESPGAGAVQIQATLEDLYLYYFPTERS